MFSYKFLKSCVSLFCVFMSVCDFLVKLGMSVRGDTKKTPIILFTCKLITAINNRKTVFYLFIFVPFAAINNRTKLSFRQNNCTHIILHKSIATFRWVKNRNKQDSHVTANCTCPLQKCKILKHPNSKMLRYIHNKHTQTQCIDTVYFVLKYYNMFVYSTMSLDFLCITLS